MEKILDPNNKRRPDKLKFQKKNKEETLPSKNSWKEAKKSYIRAKYPWTVIDGKTMFPEVYINDIEPALPAIYSMWKKGYSDEKVCEILELNKRTFRKYLHIVPEMKRLKETAKMSLVAEIEIAQIKKAKGMKTTNVTRNYKFNEAGKKELVFESETETEHTPDTSAAKLFLQSHKPEIYDRKNYREEQKELAKMPKEEFEKLIEQKKQMIVDAFSVEAEGFQGENKEEHEIKFIEDIEKEDIEDEEESNSPKESNDVIKEDITNDE